MGSVNYLIPSDQMTYAEKQKARRDALMAGMGVAVKKAVAGQEDFDLVAAGKKPSTVDIREFQNILDAGAVLDQWNTQVLAAVGTAYSALQAVLAVAVPLSRVWVFYCVNLESVPQGLSRVTFRIGGAAGNIRGVFDLERLGTQLRPEGYFSEGIIYGPNDNVAIQVLCRILTGVLARVQFGTYVIETAGQVVA